MTESNNEPSPQAAYDWDKALKTGKRDEKVSLIREEFLSTLLQSNKYDSRIFTKQLDGFSPEFQATIKQEIREYFTSKLQENGMDLAPPELTQLIKNSIEFILRESFESLLEKIVIKPHGKLVINTFQLFKIFDSIAKIVSEIQITCAPEHLQIVFMDPSRILLSIATFESESYAFFNEKRACINVEDVAKLLNCSKSELSTSTLYFGEEHLYIKTGSQKYQSSLMDRVEYLDITFGDIPTEHLQVMEYPYRFQLHPDQFQYLLKKIGDVSEIIEIQGFEDRIHFSGAGNQASRTLTYAKRDVPAMEITAKEVASSASTAQSLTFLRANNSYSQLLEKDGTITFWIKHDTPIKVQYAIDLTRIEPNQNRSSSSKIKETVMGTFNAITYIAPRAEEAEEAEEEREEDEIPQMDSETEELSDF